MFVNNVIIFYGGGLSYGKQKESFSSSVMPKKMFDNGIDYR